MNSLEHRLEADRGLSILSTLSTKEALLKIIPVYERQTGETVFVKFLGASALSTLERPELLTLDAFIGPEEPANSFAGSATLSQELRCSLAKSSSAAAFPTASPIPDIGTVEVFIDHILSVPSLCLAKGASGTHFRAVLKKYGIEDVVAQKCVAPKPGQPVGVIVARGEASFGVQQRSEILPIAGVCAVDMPAEFVKTLTYGGAAFHHTDKSPAVEKLFKFLRSCYAARIFEETGLVPFGDRTDGVSVL